MPIAENIQTMQVFLGHFNPAEAERMAEGCRARLAGDVEPAGVDPIATLKDHVSDESLLRSLSALHDAFPDLEVTFEDTIAKGHTIAVRFAVAGP